MAYNKELAVRVKKLFARRAHASEKTMFGGVGYLLNGNMCIGVWKEFLIARVGPDEYDAALARPGARKFDITGRVMPGWVMVENGFVDDDALREWTHLAIRYVKALPKKPDKSGK